MNLRRIVQGAALICCIAFFSTDSSAQQAQLAGINQDGLIQLGSNHPFVVDEYVIDVAQMGIQSSDEANELVKAYSNGFGFRFDLSDQKIYLTIPKRMIADRDMPVTEMNKQLAAIHRINR